MDVTRDELGSVRWARTMDAMCRRGGGFVRHLAEAWRRADVANHARLMLAFGHIYHDYAAEVDVPAPRAVEDPPQTARGGAGDPPAVLCGPIEVLHLCNGRVVAAIHTQLGMVELRAGWRIELERSTPSGGLIVTPLDSLEQELHLDGQQRWPVTQLRGRWARVIKE